MARKISADIPGGCSEDVSMPPEVNRHCQQTHGPIGMGRVISLRICMDMYGSIHGQKGWGLRIEF